MKTDNKLPASQLRKACDPAALAFETTETLEDLPEMFGQERAKSAIAFGIGIAHQGFNLFVQGPSGAGKHTLLRQMIGRKAVSEPRPSDWCYVFDFEQPHRPQALALPAGRGASLRDDMHALVKSLLLAVTAAFDSDDYRSRVEKINNEFAELNEKGLANVAEAASREGVALVRAPGALTLAPMSDGEVLSVDQFAALPAERQKAIEMAMATLQQRLNQVVRDAIRHHKELHERLHQLDREVARDVVGVHTEELMQRYADLP
ncbi:MAG TPA: Lon-like protease helical domain-containing protein, partial [Casimicrobiaceae bacterium]|nr:Lon-like protease helical domain-containing protein [Casimicrobiaceae bacterium]